MSIIKYCLAAFATVCCVVAAAQGSIVEREGWLDNNIAERQSIGASPALLDISSLQPGLHWFTMRVKDDQGMWSSTLTRAFFIPNEIDNSTATSIQRREVWFDNDIAGRQAIGVAPVTLDISSLSVGLHTLTMRVQNDLDYWSSTVTKFFIIPEATAVEDSVELVNYCYWFDDDVAHLVVGELPVSGKTVSGVIDVDMAIVPSSGQHTINWIIGDSNSVWGFFTADINSATFVNNRGDVNIDHAVNIADVAALINYLLTGDATNVDLVAANCDLRSSVNIGDLSKLIDYLLTGIW